MLGEVVGRTRQLKNAKLEKYVKVQIKSGRKYYSLKHPKMAKARAFGADLDKANAASIALIAHFASATDSIVDILHAQPSGLSLGDVIGAFKSDYIKLGDWSGNYKAASFSRLDKIKKCSGDEIFAELSVKDVKSIIYDNFKGDGIKQARNIMIHLYRFGVGEGWSDKTLVNYAEKVNIPVAKGRQRDRIANYQEYTDSYTKADDWLKDAMDIALITLQARSEICAMRWSHIDGNTLKVVRQKTQKYNRAYIEIEIDEELRKVLHRCRVKAMKYGSPFIINHPTRNRSHNKKHRCQVLPDYLSRAFSKVSPTTLHEIRSLGIRIYKALGMEDSWIQNLTCHGNKELVNFYAEGDQIEWTKAKATMKFGGLLSLKIKE